MRRHHGRINKHQNQTNQGGDLLPCQLCEAEDNGNAMVVKHLVTACDFQALKLHIQPLIFRGYAGVADQPGGGREFQHRPHQEIFASHGLSPLAKTRGFADPAFPHSSSILNFRTPRNPRACVSRFFIALLLSFIVNNPRF